MKLTPSISVNSAVFGVFFIFSYVEEPYANILRPGNPWGPISIDRMENRKSCDLMPFTNESFSGFSSVKPGAFYR